MLSFRRGDDGWRVEKCRLEPSGPIEEGLPGLGSEFVRQTEEWAASGLAWARGTLESNPPQGGDRTLRVSAHLMLDQVLHLNSSTSLHAVRDFAHRCAERAIEEMHSESVTEGAIVWKLYNHGWVVKTANHCWAHDFYEGPGGMALSARHVDGVLDAVEALFCSHWHGDHSSIPVIRRALAKGLPVFTAPTPDAAKGDMLRENVNNVTDFSGVPRSISVPGPFEEGTVGGIRFRAHPGHQDELPNTIFMVQADGMTIVQTGDQYNEDDYQWLRGIGEHERVDVCLPWMVELNRLVEAVRPRVVIPGHQNELGHPVRASRAVRSGVREAPPAGRGVARAFVGREGADQPGRVRESDERGDLAPPRLRLEMTTPRWPPSAD